MPHVVTTRHDLLINQLFTIPFITIVPKYCSHCYGHCTCEEMALYKSSMQTLSKSEPFWSAVSACLAQFRTPCWPDQEGVSLMCSWSNCFHYVSCRFGLVEAVFCWMIRPLKFSQNFCIYTVDGFNDL